MLTHVRDIAHPLKIAWGERIVWYGCGAYSYAIPLCTGRNGTSGYSSDEGPFRPVQCVALSYRTYESMRRVRGGEGKPAAWAGSGLIASASPKDAVHATQSHARELVASQAWSLKLRSAPKCQWQQHSSPTTHPSFPYMLPKSQVSV